MNSMTVLMKFFGDGGRFVILSRESISRQLLQGIFRQIGINDYCDYVMDDLAGVAKRQSFVSTLNPQRQVLFIIDFTSTSSGIYLQLMEELLEIYGQKFRFMALTGGGTKSFVSLLFSKGAKLIINKPFTKDDFVNRLLQLFNPPSREDQLIELGRKFLADGRSSEVLTHLDKLNISDQSSQQILLFAGDVNLAARYYVRAGHYYLLAYLRESESFYVLSALAKLCRARSSWQGQIYWLKKIADSNPLDYSLLSEIAEAYMQAGRLDEAKSYMDSSISVARKILPEDSLSNLQFKAATICAEKGAIELAKKYVSDTLRYGKVSRDTLSKVAFFRMEKLDDMDGAVDSFALLAVREEAKGDNADLDFWSVALYNAAVCHYRAHGLERHPGAKSGLAGHFVLELLRINPRFVTEGDESIRRNLSLIIKNENQTVRELNKLASSLGL